MQILPAIDLRGGQCVRLRQGDFARETVFGTDPVAIARLWVERGAGALHIVDLDGAKAGQVTQGDVIRQIVEAVPVPTQVGGGLRTENEIAEVLRWGVSRVVVGTRALLDPQWFRGVCENFPNQILLGLDARDDKLATHGWLEMTEVAPADVARKAALWPIAGIVYTDIARDGMMEGPNLDAYLRLKEAIDVPIYASGGISSAEHIRDLAGVGVAGCIIGRALYEGKIGMKVALEAADET